MSVVERDMSEYSFMRILKRFYWDLLDPDERKYLLYYSIAQFPGLTGDFIRGRFVAKRVKSAGSGLIVQSGTRFRSIENLILGNNVVIGYDNFIQAYGGVRIGNNVMTAPGVKIWSVNHNFEDKNSLIADQGVKKAEVIIGDDVWISSNAFILPGVVLPDGVVVSAGSVVGIKAYNPYAILAGNPARVIGLRR